MPRLGFGPSLLGAARFFFRRLVAVLAALVLHATAASAIKADEEVVLFPTAAHLDANAGEWVVPVHGWIYEPEADSAWRGAALAGLLAALELEAGAADGALFRRRAGPFLADNERAKRIPIAIAGRSVTLARSEANGHFRDSLRLPSVLAKARRLEFATTPRRGDGRRFEGVVHLIGPAGPSVISDIDDTIKLSDVTDKRALIANTFLREFRAVPGMAAAYRRWAAAGAAFHYLSASPWQLYPALGRFMAREGFPPGSVHLKNFRLKDQSFFDLFAAPAAHKRPRIEALLATWPGRRFVLVGDGGEKDPEIYGAMARRHPGQVAHILIRDPAPHADAARYTAAFAGLPAARWTVFGDASELAGFRLPTQD